jgi:hypothetical protein
MGEGLAATDSTAQQGGGRAVDGDPVGEPAGELRYVGRLVQSPGRAGLIALRERHPRV